MKLRGRGRITDVRHEWDTYRDNVFGRARIERVEDRLVITLEVRNYSTDSSARDLVRSGVFNVEIDDGVFRLGGEVPEFIRLYRRYGETDEELRARLMPQPQPPQPTPPSEPEERTLAVLPEGVVTHNPEPPTKEEVERPDSRFAWLEVD